MIDIVLDCSQEIRIILEKYINTLCKPNFIDYKSINGNFILIKEFKKNKDLEILKKLNKFNYALISIILDEQYIFDILDLHKTYFLRENKIENDIEIIEDCVKDFKNSKSSFVDLITNYEHIIINIHTIIYVESFAHNIIIHSTSGEFKCGKKLSEIFKQISDFGFIQIHKSYLVNKAYIDTVLPNELSLGQSIKLPIGRKYKINTLNL